MLPVLTAVVLAACAGGIVSQAELPGVGPNPPLPAPEKSLIPTVNIATKLKSAAQSTARLNRFIRSPCLPYFITRGPDLFASIFSAGARRPGPEVRNGASTGEWSGARPW